MELHSIAKKILVGLGGQAIEDNAFCFKASFKRFRLAGCDLKEKDMGTVILDVLFPFHLKNSPT